MLRRPRPVGTAEGLDRPHDVGVTRRCAWPWPGRMRHGPGQAAARTAPIGHAGDDRSRGLDGGQEDRGAPVEQPDDRAEGALGDTLGFLGVAGRTTRQRDRLGRGPFQLPYHQLSGMGGRPPVDLATAVARPVGTRTPRLAHIRLRPVGRRPLSSWSRTGRDCGLPRRGAMWSAVGRGSSTRRVHHCRANGAAVAISSDQDSCTPRCSGRSVIRSSGGRLPRPGR